MAEVSDKVKKQATANEEIETTDDLVAALKQDFATSVNRVYINSLDKEVSFREITVQEQKTLTRIMAGNEQRKDIVYDAQCALINTACLDETFDVYQVSEFDRIKLLMSIYQANMFANEIKFTCEHCGAENNYQLDFANVLEKLDDFDLDSKIFKYENKHFAYTFTVQLPTVRKVSAFYKAYCQKHKGSPRRTMKADEGLQNVEYANLFIKDVVIEVKATGKKREINFENHKVGDIEEIMAAFPQDVLYTDTGVLKYILNNFIQPMNDSFDKHTCYQCGEVHEKGDVDTTESFF